MSSFLKTASERKMRLIYLALAFGTAVLYDLLFWKQEIGLNYVLFISLFIVVFTSAALVTGHLRQYVAFFLLIPIITLTFDVFFYRNSFVAGAVPVANTALLLLYCVLLTLHNPGRFHFSFSQIPIFRSIDLPFVKWGTMYRDLLRWEGVGLKSMRYKHIAIGVCVAAPILLIFTILFANADEIFARLLESIFHITISAELVWRVFRTFSITLLLGGVFYAVVGPEHVLGESIKSALRFPQTVVATVLALINALFLLFVFIQIKYLFGSADFVFQNGLTFAEYARKGFFQLAWVVVLAAIILLIVYRSFAYHGSPKYITALQALLVVQVGVVAASALRRMNLYQFEYGYTTLRLYVEWFIYFVLTLLLLSLVCLIAKVAFRRFFLATLVLGLTALTIVASTNVDYVIAKQNVDRFLAGKKFDLKYISKLSVDSVPAVLPLLKPDSLSTFSREDVHSLWSIFDNLDKERNKRDSWREKHLGVLFVTRQWQGLQTDVWQNAKEEFKKNNNLLENSTYPTKDSYTN